MASIASAGAARVSRPASRAGAPQVDAAASEADDLAAGRAEAKQIRTSDHDLQGIDLSPRPGKAPLSRGFRVSGCRLRADADIAAQRRL